MGVFGFFFFFWHSATPLLGWGRPWSVLLPGSVEGKPGGSQGGEKGWKGGRA